jgi:uncharacterized protein YkwD
VRKSLVAVIAIVGCLAGFAPAAGARSCPDAGTAPSQLTESRAAASVICLINQQRTRHHLHAVRSNSRLWAAAEGHSVSMGTQNFFSHYGDGTPQTRAFAAGYLGGGGRWGVGEDLGWGAGGMGTPGFIVSAWMRSPEHRVVILTPGFRQIGVGAAKASPTGADDSGTMTYTALLGYHHGH